MLSLACKLDVAFATLFHCSTSGEDLQAANSHFFYSIKSNRDFLLLVTLPPKRLPPGSLPLKDVYVMSRAYKAGNIHTK
ncbi:MAG: hypothetical protein JWP44_4975, partial [Mucilaginibacter sp.]|nr:hypothetical protein [Mucilaginibacter sp.]